MAKDLVASRGVGAGGVEPGALPIEEVARLYAAGESCYELAKRCGVDRKTIRRRLKAWMLAGKGDKEYADLVTEALVNRISEADEFLDEAEDAVGVTKGRELARFARMDFERRRPQLYGQKQEVVHRDAPSFTVVLLDRPSGVTPVAVLEEKVVNEERDESKVEAIAGPAVGA